MAVLQKISVPAAAESVPETIAPVENSAQLDVVGKLNEKLKEAAESPSAKLANEINRLLPGVRSSLRPRDAADVLQNLLEKKVLNELFDDAGRSCRSVAVEQLLGLGFPYALEVSPSDLSHHRIAERGYEGISKLTLFLAMAAVIFAPAALLIPKLGDLKVLTFGLPLTVAYSATTLAALGSVWRHKPASPRAKFGRRLLAACGLLGIGAFVASFIAWWTGLGPPPNSADQAMLAAGAAAFLAPFALAPPAEERDVERDPKAE